MLTATYSLVVIATEQDKAQSILSRLRQCIQSTWRGMQKLDFAFLESAFHKLMQFDQYCRSRKIELHLIPALRHVSKEVDGLLAELDALSAATTSLLRSIGEQMEAAFDAGSAKANELCHAMLQYCEQFVIRLDKEEKELLPMARRLLTIEDWFSIAAQFLSEETAGTGRRRHASSTRALSEGAMLQ